MPDLITDEIRQDIEDAIYRMKPWAAEDGGALFAGWARMAQPIDGFNVVEVMMRFIFALLFFVICYHHKSLST